MAIPTPNTDLVAYRTWRRGVTSPPVGTILFWAIPTHNSDKAKCVRMPCYFRIMGIRPNQHLPFAVSADYLVELQACTNGGKMLRRCMILTVEALARLLDDNTITIHQPLLHTPLRSFYGQN